MLKNDMGGECGTEEREKRGAYWILMGRSLRNRPLGRPRRKW
jgi:hypothetical protein